MANNWKYTLQKHKGKIWVSGSILATAVIGTGVWLVVSEESPFSDTKEAINYMAEHVITSDQDGEVSLVQVEGKQTVSTLALPTEKPYLYAPSKNRESVYAYNGKELHVIREIDGTLKAELVSIALPEIAEPTRFAYDGNQLVVYSEGSNIVTTISMEDESIISEVNDMARINELYVNGAYSYYITDSELVQLDGKNVNRVTLGENLKSIHPEGDHLVIQSDFGNAKGENVLFYVNGENLEIESLQKTGAPDTVMLSKDDGETHFVAGHYVVSETPYHLMGRYKIEANRFEKDNLTINIPSADKAVAMNAENSVLDHDYIYSHDEETLKVFDVKSQQYIHDVPVTVDFAMPVLYEGGDSNE